MTSTPTPPPGAEHATTAGTEIVASPNRRLIWPIVGFVNIAILWAGFDTVREIFGV